MKKLIFITALLLSFSAFSANIIGYGSKEEGEKEYVVLVGSSVVALTYNEDDKILKVIKPDGGYYMFKVKSDKEAQKIISKVLDTQDKSIIELNFL